MTLTRTVAWIVLALSVIYYRSGSLIKNAMIYKAPLPVGYTSNGQYKEDCTPIGPGDASDETLKYCEDTAFWDIHNGAGKVVDRLVLASCDPGRKGWNTVMGPLRNPEPRGALWVYTPPSGNNPGKKAQKIAFKNYPEGHDFHPLGFEIWPSYNGNSSNLYVINHARERTVIEQFVLNPTEPTVATYARTISSPYFVAPNSLALTSPDSFYVTNDHLITRRWPVIGQFIPLVESLLAIPLAFVSHVTLNPSSSKDAISSHTFAATFIPFPNGIAISSSGKQVALSVTSLGQVIFFERDPATNVLTRRTHVVPVPFCSDNVRFAKGENGQGEELIVAGHPHFPSLTHLAANATGITAGSWVLSIIPKENQSQSFAKNGKSFDADAPVSASGMVSDGPTWTLKTLFQSDGSDGGFASSTTGIRDPDSGTLYISGLYDEQGLLACRPRKK